MLQASELSNLSFMTAFLPVTETWLKDSWQDLYLFPQNYIVLRPDMKSSRMTRGGGVLIDINSIFRGSKRLHGLQLHVAIFWLS